MIPIRLWSTVVSQLVTRPVVHGAGRTSGSALTATLAASPVDARALRRALHPRRPRGPVRLVHVLVERGHLAVAPRAADGGHRRAAVPDDRLQSLPVVQ